MKNDLIEKYLKPYEMHEMHTKQIKNNRIYLL
jgi:hypothetical protein